ncbi:MAG: hypothetical protein JHC95_16285 [Solirubrobacteraceae bacterium]|nr:hypothetical protein [Solirubrobacteraceae bacterium]
MAVITVTFPTDEEEDLQRRFTVNKNYLQAVSGFITTTYGRREKLYAGLRATVEAMPQHQKIQRDPNVDLDEVRRYLTLAWTSEIQLHLPAIMGTTGMLAFANTWAPVHAYYAVYGSLQAWIASNGMTGTADDHTATLRTIAKQIEQRNLFPEPWNLLAVGCPMRGDRLYLNDNGRNVADHVEVLSIPIPFGEDPEFWPRLGTWLRSTREARLTKREEQWKAKNSRKKVGKNERTQFAQNLAPTSLFDCFWRMRIKSNYGTIDPYLVNHIGESEHSIYNSALCTITRATVALLELFVMRRIGTAEFARIATEFLNSDSHKLSARMLRARLDSYGIVV